MLNCPSLLKFLKRLTGEAVLPHLQLMDAPGINVGKIAAEDDVIKGTVDPWHFDSVTYVCVAMLSDQEGMVGGDLEVIKRRKDDAMRLIASTGNQVSADDVERVRYERKGAAVLVQGAEMVHRVTKVQAGKEARYSLVMAFQPANPFHPDKTSMDTFERYDGPIAAYEFYRMKAHALGHSLAELARLTPMDTERAELASHLRIIAAEINRNADIVDKSRSDYVGFVDESAYI
jgi:hypothetical protein